MPQFHISKVNGQLVLEKSKWSHLLELAFLFVFFAIWYYGLLFGGGQPVTKRLAGDLILWLFVISPLLFAPRILKDIKIVAIGEVFVFDRGGRSLLKDGFEVCPLGRVDYLQIRTFEGEGTEYRLSVILLDETKIQIDSSSDKEEIFRAAEEIADYVGVKVIEE